MDRSMEAAPARHTIPPTSIDWTLIFSAMVTMKGEAMLPRFDIAYTMPVPLVFMLGGNDSVVIRENSPKQNAEWIIWHTIGQATYADADSLNIPLSIPSLILSPEHKLEQHANSSRNHHEEDGPSLALHLMAVDICIRLRVTGDEVGDELQSADNQHIHLESGPDLVDRVLSDVVHPVVADLRETQNYQGD